MISLKPGETYTCVGIDARRVWNRTGVQLYDDNEYRFEAVNVVDWRDKNISSSPDGDKRGGVWNVFRLLCRAPHLEWYQLVGSIDGHDDFGIGSRLNRYRPQASGELRCFANDVRGFYGNNHGTLDLVITCLS